MEQTSADSLFGRERDVAALAAFARQAGEDGGAVLVTGEAGVGKSALVNPGGAAARRRGMPVLRAAGAEFEAALSFAGLEQLLHPVLGRLAELAPGGPRALGMALGVGDGRASDEFAVANATLRLLAVVAGGAPLLVVVDDVNWLDRASASVLAYVARRVGGEGGPVIGQAPRGRRQAVGGSGLAEPRPVAAVGGRGDGP